MTADDSQTDLSLSFVVAESRAEAIEKMVLRNPLLKQLYSPGKNNDGKGGFVNAIRDQHGAAYRLLFYVNKLKLAPGYRDQEPYEVLYGEIDPEDDEPNFPRALFTTTGAMNLMRDGLPGQKVVDAIKAGILQIVPLTLGRDLLTKRLRENGAAYLGIYDRDGEGLRILDLQDFVEVYDDPKKNEVQVRSEESIVIGHTRWVRPFLLKYAIAERDQTNEEETLDAASIASRFLNGG